MSQEADASSRRTADTQEVNRGERLTVESGLDALNTSSEFHGTVEPLDGLEDLETCDHIALFSFTLPRSTKS